MFWNRSSVAELDPVQVQDLLARGDVTLIDVREQAEYDAERIEGAVCMPLSRFDPSGLGVDPAALVLHCLSGKRSAMAASHCKRLGLAAVRHMRGGLVAWKAAGLPTCR
ncbi:MAG: rhodanese-like domain-containing protein [Rhodospirillales bacterium]|nr:rhodanese-like domain-containing protein [Rhodospirillales bacterium]